MASMQCYKEEGKEFDYYSYGNQKPSYSSSGYEQSHYEKEKCYETKPGKMGYGSSHGHQHGSNPCGPMMGHNSGYGTGHNGTSHGMSYGTGHGMGYGTGHNSNSHGMGYGTGHSNTHGMGYTGHNMHKPKPGMGLGHVMGFGKKHDGHSSYAMGSSGCTTYKKQHLRERKGYGSNSDCSDSSDDERHC